MNRVKKIFPFMVLLGMLMIPSFASAAMKGLTMNMSESKKSISCVCAAALVQGGAMIGGDGIDYVIKSTTQEKGTITMKKGSCASNVSFAKYEYTSPSGWSGTLKLTETQHNKSNPGIGWGRIDY